MSRRRHHEEHPNHEAWVIPYADLLTLLLALFVVLYAMSSINTTKYRALAQAISAAFNGSREVIRPLQTPAAPNSIPAPSPAAPTPNAPMPKPIVTPNRSGSTRGNSQGSDASLIKLSSEQQNLERIHDQVERALQPLIDKNMVVVRRTTNWLEIEIRTDILFPSGVATLAPSAAEVLTRLGGILAPFANPLRIEGYTDDVPINTAMFPSNWELSAARAASVARLFADHGVAPDRMGIIGWGQYHPANDNDSQEGRNRNRRVLVVVLSDRNAPARFYSNSDQLTAQQQADGTAQNPVAGAVAGVPDHAAAAEPTAVEPSAIGRAAVMAAPQLVLPEHGN